MIATQFETALTKVVPEVLNQAIFKTMKAVKVPLYDNVLVRKESEYLNI